MYDLLFRTLINGRLRVNAQMSTWTINKGMKAVITQVLRSTLCKLGYKFTIIDYIFDFYTLNSPTQPKCNPVWSGLFIIYQKPLHAFFYTISFGLYMIKSIMNTLYNIYWSYVRIWARTGLFCTHRWMWWWYVCNYNSFWIQWLMECVIQKNVEWTWNNQLPVFPRGSFRDEDIFKCWAQDRGMTQIYIVFGFYFRCL